jgi:hypothetical protein
VGWRLTGTNPWLVSPERGAEADADATPQVPVAPAPEISAWARAQATGVSAPRDSDRLARRMVDGAAVNVTMWWVGAHGGAGESTLEQLLEGSRASGHAWPCGDPGTGLMPPVVIVARTNARGLRAAQLVAIEWASGSVPVALHGLVLVADAPGKLPKPLRDFAQIVSGGVPHVWHLPWVEAWRQGEPVSGETTPKAIVKVLNELRALQHIPSAVPFP